VLAGAAFAGLGFSCVTVDINRVTAYYRDIESAGSLIGSGIDLEVVAGACVREGGAGFEDLVWVVVCRVADPLRVGLAGVLLNGPFGALLT
jgi:hypothetical protein